MACSPAPLPRSIYEKSLRDYLPHKSWEEDFETLFEWLNGVARGVQAQALPEFFQRDIQIEEERRAEEEEERPEEEEEEEERFGQQREAEDQPTLLMSALNQVPSNTADWNVVDQVLQGADSNWQRKLRWVWPADARGPAGYPTLLLTANKYGGGDLRKTCLVAIFAEAIRQGIFNVRGPSKGKGLLHTAVNQTNRVVLEAMKLAEDVILRQLEEERFFLPAAHFPDWSLLDDQGLTPMGIQVIANHGGTKAPSQEARLIMIFLEDRLADLGWAPADIARHKDHQRRRGQELHAQRVAQTSNAKRRRVEDRGRERSQKRRTGPSTTSRDWPIRAREPERASGSRRDDWRQDRRQDWREGWGWGRQGSGWY